ncbi:MAG: permease, partial [Chloroflexota bacterium]|nr:permease [Chloroflexota bacterium]
MNLLPSALPWRGVLIFPMLLIFIGVVLFSTATLAFYVKQTLSFSMLRKVFDRWPGIVGSLIAALLGAATPFCTCTAVPLFLGMLEVDVPLGPAVSFLLASPTINLGAIVLLLIVFGWRIALFYTVACLVAAVLVGWVMGRLPREQALRNYLWFEEDEPAPSAPRMALKKAVLLGGQLTRKLLPWLALATLAGILIDALLPTVTVAHLGQWSVRAGVPVAALLGSVIYADILLLIPIGFALIQHGAAVPIVLTFMIAASGLSLPEFVVLSRILRPRMVLLFIAATMLVYMLVGFG